jgi:hypothetical protein
MVTSGDDHALEKIDALLHPEESMDFEYEASQVLQSTNLELTIEWHFFVRFLIKGYVLTHNFC